LFGAKKKTGSRCCNNIFVTDVAAKSLSNSIKGKEPTKPFPGMEVTRKTKKIPVASIPGNG
jgi:hypothetical protein